MILRAFLAAACVFSIASAAESPTPAFTPFEHWRSAVVSGNANALEELYLKQPPARLLLGKDQTLSLDTEVKYWTSLRASGITDVNPKVLSQEQAQGKAQLVLRIDARAGDKKLVASMAQLWVQQLDGWHLAITQRSDFGVESPRTLPEPVKPNPSLYPAPSAAPAELQAACVKAAREHKRLLIVFGANWCYDCHVLDATFHSPAFAPIVNSNYVLVHVNIGDEGQDNNDIAAQYGIAIDHGVPTLVVVEADGKTVVARQTGFTATARIGPGDVRSFLETWKAHRTS